jgi:hypothetical protein
MSSHAGTARRATRLTTVYVAAWGILATAAVAYLMVLAFRPDVSGIITRVAPAPPEPTQVQRTISKALAELQSVRQCRSGDAEIVKGSGARVHGRHRHRQRE